MAHRRQAHLRAGTGPADDLSHLTPEEIASRLEQKERYAEEIGHLRSTCDRLGFHAICPDPACGRGRRCRGPETPRTRMMPPCFVCYREEFRFLTLSPWSIGAILDMAHAEHEPEPPGTPGCLAWVERVAQGLLESLHQPERAARGMMAIIYGVEGLPLLRRSLGAMKGSSYENNPDAFALAMAMGDWRGPLLPR